MKQFKNTQTGVIYTPKSDFVAGTLANNSLFVEVATTKSTPKPTRKSTCKK